MQFDYWQLLAGLVLFLLAMSLVEEAVHGFAGRRFRELLERNSRSPIRGILGGTFATAVLQSSSLVSLMMLAFVGARVMRMRDALLVVFGANLGTTATGWIVATIGFRLDLEALALPMIALGGLAAALLSARDAKHYGRLMMGIGLILLALQFMKTAVEGASALVDPQDIAQFSAIEFLLFGAVVAAVVQSSSATMVIALSLLDGGIIDLPAAAALAIGADLGTTSTVLLGAIGGSVNKKRLALGHLLFNLVTDSFAFLLRIPLLAVLSWLNDPLLILVGFHSAFNLLGLLLLTPFIGRFADLLERLVATDTERISRYLEEVPEPVPGVALDAMAHEVRHLLDRCIQHNGEVFGIGAGQNEGSFLQEYRATRQLEGEILSYALGFNREQLDPQQTERLTDLLYAARNGLMSGKLIKDVLEDFEGLADSAEELHGAMRDAHAEFYRLLSELMSAPASQSEQSGRSIGQLVEERHQLLHDAVYRAVREGKVPLQDISSVLNINRNLYNADRNLLDGVVSLKVAQAV